MKANLFSHVFTKDHYTIKRFKSTLTLKLSFLGFPELSMDSGMQSSVNNNESELKVIRLSF